MGLTRRLSIPLTLLILVAGVFHMGPALQQRWTYARALAENEAARASLEGMAQAEQLSRLFRQVARTVGPAVVEVRVTKRVQAPDFGDLFEHLPPQFRPRFGRPDQDGPREFRREGLGSGVIVDAENGYVLTNNHVVADADEVEIVLHDGRTLKAERILRDPMTDLAVVSIPAEGLISAPLGDSDAMEVGDWVLAIGSPSGLTQTVTSGIISAKGRRTARTRQYGLYEDYLQTDAAINRGNSGGPLVNMRGEVVGINTAIVTPTGAFAGIGLSIPSSLARNVMTQLIETGRVARGYLGIRFEETDDGVRIVGMLDDSPAARGGVEVGDVVVAMNGREIEDGADFRYRVGRLAPGSTVVLTVRRDGKRVVTLNVTLGEQPEDMARAFGLDEPEQPSQEDVAARWGLRVADLTPELARRLGLPREARGVVVTEVADALVGRLSLRPGMMILSIEGQEVASAAEVVEKLHQADPASGVVLRVRTVQGRTMRIWLTGPDDPDDRR